jgi:hypothetical protein
MRLLHSLSFFTTLALLGSGCATNTPNKTPEPAKSEEQPWVKVSVNENEQKIIRDYYGSQSQDKKKKKLPPGLQKKLDRGGSLPLGWQNKVTKGEVLSEELYAQAEPLPDALILQLPKAQDGTVTVRIEGKIIRIYKSTREILDVFDL